MGVKRAPLANQDNHVSQLCYLPQSHVRRHILKSTADSPTLTIAASTWIAPTTKNKLPMAQFLKLNISHVNNQIAVQLWLKLFLKYETVPLYSDPTTTIITI